MRIGLYVSAARGKPLDAILADFARAEDLGFHTAWAGQLFDHDGLTLLALASRTTRRIELGSWVLPIQPRHPVVLAQQALTVQAASGDRLLLGIGVSHAEVVEKRLGLDHSAPEPHMREYLSVLRPLLAGDPVEHAGERYRVSLALGTLGASPPPILLGALGPRMLGLAGEAADGAAIWLGGPRFLSEFAVPRVRGAARAAGRPAPRIAAGLPVALTRDDDRARRSARDFLIRSARLPAYQRALAREGVAEAEELALIGDEAHLAAALDRLAAVGVTDFTAVLFPVEGDAAAAGRTRSFLAERARAAAAPTSRSS